MPDFFSVVVPVHNEESFLEEALAAMRSALTSIGSNPDIYLVENGSTDATLESAGRLAEQDPRLHVLSLPEADYGAAMREGLMVAPGEWVVTFDVDYYSEDFLRRLHTIRGDADVVIASKRAPGSEDRRSSFRRVGTWVFNGLVRLLLGTRVTDTHGIKAFSRRVIAQLAGKVLNTKDLFDTELVLRAERAGFRIVEVPIVVEEKRQARSSYIKRVPGAIRGLLQLRSVLPARDWRNTTSR